MRAERLHGRGRSAAGAPNPTLMRLTFANWNEASRVDFIRRSEGFSSAGRRWLDGIAGPEAVVTQADLAGFTVGKQTTALLWVCSSSTCYYALLSIRLMFSVKPTSKSDDSFSFLHLTLPENTRLVWKEITNLSVLPQPSCESCGVCRTVRAEIAKHLRLRDVQLPSFLINEFSRHFSRFLSMIA